MRDDSDLDALSGVLRGFSCPHEELDESFLVLLAREHAVGATRLFLERHKTALDDAGERLAKVLGEWADAGGAVAGAIDPAFGAVYSAIRGGTGNDPAQAAATLGLYLASQGVLGSWSVELRRPARLRFGAFLLPTASALRVQASHGEVEIAIDGERDRLRLRRRGFAGWSCDEDREGSQRLPEVALERWRVLVLDRDAAGVRIPEHLWAETVEAIEPAMLDSIESAFGVLRAFVPEYVPWVGRVLTHALLLNPKRGFVESGSLDHYFGFCHFSAYANPTGLAELLVHEASHQYFNLLCLLAPFDDGGDKTLYYSTAVRRERPLDRIGVAYHAFANVLIFYRACLAGGIDDDGWCERHLERWAPDLRVLEEPLRGNPALTAVGAALCEPLIERLGLASLAP